MAAWIQCIQRIKRLVSNESGLEIVEWVTMGALMLTLIAVIYGVMNHDGRLREALTALYAGYAENFGRDVVTQSPGMPASSGRVIIEEDGMLMIDDPNRTLRAMVDPLTGAYTLINTATGEQTIVQPGSAMLVSVDTARGLVSLADERHNRTIVVRPLHHHAAVIEHTTGTVTSLHLTELQHTGAVAIQHPRLPHLDRLTAPVLGLPAIVMHTP
jgi:hypothetical protein